MAHIRKLFHSARGVGKQVYSCLTIFWFLAFLCPVDLNAQPPTSTPSSQSAPAAEKPVRYRHRLLLNPSVGLPAVVAFTSDAELTQVRVLLEVDSELLTLPLEYLPKYKGFRGQFPTPARSLRYQFQFIQANGSSFVTEEFVVSPECEENEYEKLLEQANQFPEQRELLSRAVELQKQSEKLKYLVDAVEKVVRYEQ